MKLLLKILWSCVLPIAVIVDVLVLVFALFSIFDGSGMCDISPFGLTSMVHGRITGKNLVKTTSSTDVSVKDLLKTSVNPECKGFDWMRLFMWSAIASVLIFGLILFAMS